MNGAITKFHHIKWCCNFPPRKAVLRGNCTVSICSYVTGIDQAVTLHVEPTFSRNICSPISAAILLMTMRSLEVILNWRPPMSEPGMLETYH